MGAIEKVRAWRPSDGVAQLLEYILELGRECKVAGVDPASCLGKGDIRLPALPGNAPIDLIWAVDTEGLALTPTAAPFTFRIVPLKALILARSMEGKSRKATFPIRADDSLVARIDAYKEERGLSSRNQAIVELIEAGLTHLQDRKPSPHQG